MSKYKYIMSNEKFYLFLQYMYILLNLIIKLANLYKLR